MHATAAPLAQTDAERRFGIFQLFLSDARLAGVVTNDLRHRGIDQVFGVPREQTNLLTLVLALSVASGTFHIAGRVLRAPLAITGMDVATGTVLLREAAAGVAGPKARATPMFGTLLAGALLGGALLPGMRRAVHTARLAERRAREHRIARYIADSRIVAGR